VGTEEEAGSSLIKRVSPAFFIASIVGLAFAQGCANHCDTYPDTLNDKLTECGIEVEEPPPEDEAPPEPSCTDALNAQAECLEDCIPEGCGAFDGSDEKASKAYGECRAKSFATQQRPMGSGRRVRSWPWRGPCCCRGMKTFTRLAPVVAFGLIAGCGSTHDEPLSAADASKMKAENGTLAGRVSAAEATPKLATAECERQMRCNNIGEGLQYTSVGECQREKTKELTKDFNDDEDCKNGISNKGLQQCVTKTVDQTCGASVITSAQVSFACGSNDLCMD
jgi:hypothetical protein